MNAYENHIYLIICEITTELFKKTSCTTHGGYCRLLRYSINDKNLSYREKLDIIEVINALKIIFEMKDEVAFDYFVKYLNEEKFSKFESIVFATRSYYPNSGKIKIIN
jgi:hypothetical protein